MAAKYGMIRFRDYKNGFLAEEDAGTEQNLNHQIDAIFDAIKNQVADMTMPKRGWLDNLRKKWWDLRYNKSAHPLTRQADLPAGTPGSWQPPANESVIGLNDYKEVNDLIDEMEAELNEADQQTLAHVDQMIDHYRDKLKIILAKVIQRIQSEPKQAAAAQPAATSNTLHTPERARERGLPASPEQSGAPERARERDLPASPEQSGASGLPSWSQWRKEHPYDSPDDAPVSHGSQSLPGHDDSSWGDPSSEPAGPPAKPWEWPGGPRPIPRPESGPVKKPRTRKPVDPDKPKTPRLPRATKLSDEDIENFWKRINQLGRPPEGMEDEVGFDAEHGADEDEPADEEPVAPTPPAEPAVAPTPPANEPADAAEEPAALDHPSHHEGGLEAEEIDRILASPDEVSKILAAHNVPENGPDKDAPGVDTSGKSPEWKVMWAGLKYMFKTRKIIGPDDLLKQMNTNIVDVTYDSYDKWDYVQIAIDPKHAKESRPRELPQEFKNVEAGAGREYGDPMGERDIKASHPETSIDEFLNHLRTRFSEYGPAVANNYQAWLDKNGYSDDADSRSYVINRLKHGHPNLAKIGKVEQRKRPVGKQKKPKKMSEGCTISELVYHYKSLLRS